MTQRITVSPDPLKSEKSGQICYSFPNESDDPIELEITWTPAGTPTSVTVSPQSPCANITVPSASSVTITDPTGDSDPYVDSVSP